METVHVILVWLLRAPRSCLGRKPAIILSSEKFQSQYKSRDLIFREPAQFRRRGRFVFKNNEDSGYGTPPRQQPQSRTCTEWEKIGRSPLTPGSRGPQFKLG